MLLKKLRVTNKKLKLLTNHLEHLKICFQKIIKDHIGSKVYYLYAQLALRQIVVYQPRILGISFKF